MKKKYLIEAAGDGDACKFIMHLNDEELGAITELIHKCDTYMKTEYLYTPFLAVYEYRDSEKITESGTK